MGRVAAPRLGRLGFCLLLTEPSGASRGCCSGGRQDTVWMSADSRVPWEPFSVSRFLSCIGGGGGCYYGYLVQKLNVGKVILFTEDSYDGDFVQKSV